MTPELIAVPSVGIALGGMFLHPATGQAGLRRGILELRGETAKELASVRGETARELASVRTETADMRVSIARLEGVFDGFAAGRTEPPPPKDDRQARRAAAMRASAC